MEPALPPKPTDEPRDAPDPALDAAVTLARWMDQRFLDPLLGLFLPGVGDLISSGLGVYPILLAWRRGAPGALVARMLLNLSVDALGGSIPVLGDIWDFLFRAHSRNVTLLKARAVGGGKVRSRPADVLIVAAAAALFLVALAAPVVVAIVVVRAIFS
jgi:Domain of unknown function (DUF4112)